MPSVRILLCTIILGLFIACTTRHTATTSAPAFLAQLDTTCDFVPVLEHPNPTILASEFVERAARGTFAQAETWMAPAVACVGHESGYDTFDIVGTFSLTPLDSTFDLRRMILRRNIVGDYAGGQFHAHRGIGIDTLLIDNTPFGWRIRNPVWNWIMRDAAIQRKWLADTTGRKS